MPKKSRKRQNELPVMHPDGAGVDIGAEETFVAVPADRDGMPVRRFPTFTQDLLEAAAWLKQCGIRRVAMESTRVYWIPLYQILETEGFEVFLVNARYVKHVPGRKTAVSDCQWIQLPAFKSVISKKWCRSCPSVSSNGTYSRPSFKISLTGNN